MSLRGGKGSVGKRRGGGEARLVRFAARDGRPPRAKRPRKARPPVLPRLVAGGLVLAVAVALAPELLAQPGFQPDLMPRGPESSSRLIGQGDVPGAAPAGRPAPRLGAATVGAPADTNAPVTFQADEVQYDREAGIVTARGHVEAWQGERVLRADLFTYNRNTGVITAVGNVQLLEADGQVMFADTAELRDHFRDGVLEGVRAILAANGRMAANGVRRTDGTINELSRVVYSSCNLCAEDPTRPPLWQVRARVATQDKNDLRITYRDAVVQMAGIPVLYTPYLSHPDPSTPRASGFLFPTLGSTKFLGAFTELPYFWAISPSSDLLTTLNVSYRQYPNLGFEYRNALNFGEILGSASIGAFQGINSQGNLNGKENVAGHIFLRGRFTIDENWRAGFDLNRASSDLYLQTYRFEYRRVLTSQIYVEGFWGTEQFARIDMRGYQGLRQTTDANQIPYVLPNATYERAPREPVLGGLVTIDANALGIVRPIGSRSERVASRIAWERPEIDPWGGMWTFKLLGETAGYNAAGQQLAPTNLPSANGNNAFANIRAAIDWRMPFVRNSEMGSQIIEPRVQFVTGPNMGQQTNIPNSDAIDFEYSDANLFQLNRYTGRDRQDGGTRVDAALRGVWNFPNGGQIDGMMGRSWRFSDLSNNPYVNSGIGTQASDYVSRLRFAPVPWLETIARVRLNTSNFFDRRGADGITNISLGRLTLSAGYLYTVPMPYLLNLLTPTSATPRARDEVAGGFGARINDNWRITGGMKYDLGSGRFALIQGSLTYEDECFLLELRGVKRFAENVTTGTIYPGNTMVLMRLSLKTLGDYYFRAI